MNFEQQNNLSGNNDKTSLLSSILDDNSLSALCDEPEPHSEFGSPFMFRNEEQNFLLDNGQSDNQNSLSNFLDSPRYDEEKNEDKYSHYFLDNSTPDIINNQEEKKNEYKEKENTINISSKLFTSEKAKQKTYRNDFYKKHFKVNFIKFLKSYGNSLIKKSPFPLKLKKKLVFSLPNTIKFTSNSKESDNFNFLFLKIEEILILGKESENGGSLQKKNYQVINIIKNYLEKLNEQEEKNFSEIKNFLFDMTLEDAYELFYKSKDFEDFKKDEKTIFYDKEFIKEKHFSLLENNGFIRLTKMYQKRKE